MTCTCGQGPNHHLPTCPQFKGVRGIDSKRRLLAFFAQKEFHNLILRIVDVMELRGEQLVRVVGMVQQIEGGSFEAVSSTTLKQWFLRRFPDGFIALPIDKLLEPLTLRQVEDIQQVVAEYREVRLRKGWPARTDKHAKCGGAGCRDCDNTGVIITFLEMDPDEIERARRAP